MKSLLILGIYVLKITFCLSQVINVSTSTQLKNALAVATPGQIITLADGMYKQSGGFIVPAGINGTSASPIKLTGSSKTIISSDNLSTGYGLALKGNNYWILQGFTVYKSKKGIVLDNSHHTIIENIKVNYIGEEGIHLRTYSSYNTVQNCFVDSTGSTSSGAGYGEGIYIGSAYTNWGTYTNGNPDTCNYNIVRGNLFGSHVGAENIDIKEGTKSGMIENNTFNGLGLTNLHSDDSWVDVKGNDYTIKCNTGSNSLLDGYQTHIQLSGWGDYNTFSNNKSNVNATGYGIKILNSGSAGTATHNVVCVNNVATNAGSGLTNVTAQACSGTCDSVNTGTKGYENHSTSKIYAFPNPSNDGLFNLTMECKWKIYNLLGVEMKSGIGDRVDLMEFSKGVYFIKTGDTIQKIIYQ